MLLKYALILGIVVYVFYKIGSFFFRAGAAAQQLRDMQNQKRKEFEGSKPAPTPKDKKGKARGGDYIDYEEVK